METLAMSALALGTVAAAWPAAAQRIALSRAKHRSLAGHSRMAKRVASLIPGYSYDEATFFAADDAPPEIVAHRRSGFADLCQLLGERL